MCTVSIIPFVSAGRSGYRLVSSRDEQRARTEAQPARWRELSRSLRGIWPTDPEGGGTWIAAATSGLGLAILNRNLEPPLADLPPSTLVSRGKLIPKLIDAADLAEVVDRIRGLPLALFSPFRLVAVALNGPVVRCLEVTWDRTELEVAPESMPPICFASSGLGDSLVTPRLGLFSELVGDEGLAASQDAFHHHRWPDKPEISVMMSREDARTVSITTCEVVRGIEDHATVRMSYAPVLATEAPSGARIAHRGLRV